MIFALWFVAVFSFLPPANSQNVEVAKEYKVKVAYVYNFARYIKWPRGTYAGADATFVIGVHGEAPFGDNLKRLAESRQIQGHRIVIQHYETPQDYKPCQILFITESVDDESRDKIVKLTKAEPVLIVGESSGFATHGAGINFYHDVDDTIGFEINVDNLRQRHLSVDARLLKLARIVGDEQ
ncbi:MAG: YfiR family protein [Pirellulales bacterium]|nr:YfiR family protein [Pirellulales bacterium]